MEKIIKHGKHKNGTYMPVYEVCDTCGKLIDQSEADYVARHKNRLGRSSSERILVYEHEKCFKMRAKNSIPALLPLK